MIDTDLIRNLQMNQYALESAYRQLRILVEQIPSETSKQWARGEYELISLRLRANHDLLCSFGTPMVVT